MTRGERLTLALLAALTAALAARLFTHGQVFTSDTLRLVSGTGALDGCLRQGIHPCPDIDKWPLLQYLPALAVKRLGGDPWDALNALGVLNALSALGTLVLVYLAGRSTRVAAAAPLLVASVLASPLLWYASSGFGEALACFFVTLYIVALVLRWPSAVVALALIGGGLSKETALPFLLAFGLVAVRIGHRERPPRSVALALVAGAVVVIAASVGFNELRFGAPYNTIYADPDFVVPDWSYRGSFFAGYLVAPNAGLVVFWPAAALTAALALAAGAVQRKLVLATVAITLVLLASFASWWAPYGWFAWGARFAVPWVPAIVLLLVLLAGPELGDRVASLWSRLPLRVGAGVVVALLSLAQVGAFLQPAGALSAQLSGRPGGEHVVWSETLVRDGDEPAKRAAERSVHRSAWSADDIERGYDGLRGTDLAFALLFLAALAALLVSAARAPARSPA